MEYCRIRVSGKYDYDNSIFIGPKVYEGVHGFHLITPLLRDGDGLPILVNRGFVSKDHIPQVDNSATRPLKVEVLGLLHRGSPTKYWSTPNNKPDENAWYWLDTRAVLRQCGRGGSTEPFRDVYLEEIFQGNPGEVQSRMGDGTPVGRAPTVELRNNHATYAFIW
jgi:surfeit locus 1 family protein